MSATSTARTSSANEATGIWKHWKSIIAALAVLFAIAVVVDVMLWYSLRDTSTAAQTLNDLIASHPPAPKTDEEKTTLLDTFAAAHREAITQLESQNPDRTIPDVYKPTPVPEGQTAPSPTDPVVQAKLKFMESMLQQSQ